MVISHSKLFWGVKWGRDPIEVLKETVEMWVSPTASYLSPPSTAKRIDAMMFFWLSNLCWSSKGLLLNLKSWIRSKSVDSKRIPGRQTNGCPQIDSRSAGLHSPGSVSSYSSLSALAWWTCRMAIRCRAEAGGWNKWTAIAVTPDGPAIQSSEIGGGHEAALGSERHHPQLLDLLMQFWVE